MFATKALKFVFTFYPDCCFKKCIFQFLPITTASSIYTCTIFTIKSILHFWLTVEITPHMWPFSFIAIYTSLLLHWFYIMETNSCSHLLVELHGIHNLLTYDGLSFSRWRTIIIVVMYSNFLKFITWLKHHLIITNNRIYHLLSLKHESSMTWHIAWVVAMANFQAYSMPWKINLRGVCPFVQIFVFHYLGNTFCSERKSVCR